MHGACAWLVPSLPDLSHPKLTQATEQIAETGLLKAAVVSINFQQNWVLFSRGFQQFQSMKHLSDHANQHQSHIKHQCKWQIQFINLLIHLLPWPIIGSTQVEHLHGILPGFCGASTSKSRGTKWFSNHGETRVQNHQNTSKNCRFILILILIIIYIYIDIDII